MATWNFDTVFPGVLTGTMNIPIVKDADGTPNNVLEIARQYMVILDWELKGNGACTLGGHWLIKISLESLGDGYEGPVKQDTVPYTSVTPGSTMVDRKWHAELPITNPIGDPKMIPGVYKLVVLILYHDPLDRPDAMAAFSEGPTIAFYEPGP